MRSYGCIPNARNLEVFEQIVLEREIIFRNAQTLIHNFFQMALD